MVCQDGKLYMWGGNSDNKLGIKSDKDFEELPTQIPKITGAFKVNLNFKLIYLI